MSLSGIRKRIKTGTWTMSDGRDRSLSRCETLPSKASPHTLTRLGVELVRIRQNKEN
jgi:hypothetical protein